MAVFTIADLRKLLRSPGTVYFPVLVPNDVVFVEVNKSGVLDLISEYDSKVASPWKPIANSSNSTTIDVQDLEG